MTPLTDLLTLSTVSHGHGALLLRLLGDLNAQAPLRGVRVLVTLNMQPESFDPAGFGNLQIEVIRNTEPLGFGANHNQAFRRCQTEWFGILNPDLRLVDDVFGPLMDRASVEGSIGLLAPRVLNSDGAIEDSVRENLTPWSILKRVALRGSDRLSQSAPDRFRWYAGMFYLVRAGAFRRVGGFDERYFLYCEDYDLCARMHLEGTHLVHLASVTVVHDAQRDSHRSGVHLRRHLASLLRVWCSTPVWRIAIKQLRRPRSDRTADNR